VILFVLCEYFLLRGLVMIVVIAMFIVFWNEIGDKRGIRIWEINWYEFFHGMI